MSEWRTIDTAPKDGTPIDVWVRSEIGREPTGRRYCNAFREGNGWKWFDPYYNGDGGYIGLDNGVNVFVTHWMPLPAPPSLSEGEVK